MIYNLSEPEVEMVIYRSEEEGVPQVCHPRHGTLEAYQTLNVASMYYAGNCILGDSVGMGKTVEVAGLMNLLGGMYDGDEVFRYLFLTEKRGAKQVRGEMVRFTGNYAYLLPSGEAKALDKYYELFPPEETMLCSVVGTHNLIKAPAFFSWVEMYRQLHGVSPFEILVVDESSVLGGKKTDFVKNFKAMMGYFKRVVFLNATPFESNLSIFYRQLDLLDSKFMPTVTHFQREYCVMDYRGMYPRMTNKYKNTGAFKELIRYRYFASTRRENGGVMQDCKGGVVLSDLSKEQKRLMQLSQLKRMIYDCPSALDEGVAFTPENVPKLGSLLNIIRNEVGDNDTLLVYVHFKEAQSRLYEVLTSRGYTVRVLNGDTKERDSNEIIEEFRVGGFQILLTNVQKCLNFGGCDKCVFYSVTSNPSELVQFEGRMTRSFDIIGKSIWILCSRGREYKGLMDVVKSRAQAMSDVTTVDYSLVLDILLGEG